MHIIIGMAGLELNAAPAGLFMHGRWISKFLGARFSHTAFLSTSPTSRPIVSSAAQALVTTMATVRRVRPGDLLKLNLCNLDALTENYDLNFYLTYLMKWPSLFQCIEEHG